MNTTPLNVEIISISEFSENNRSGAYNVSINSNGSVTYLSGVLENTTRNRCILQGMIEAVDKVPSPADVRFVSARKLGAAKPSGPNADLISALHEKLAAGRHTHRFEINTVMTDSFGMSLFLNHGHDGLLAQASVHSTPKVDSDDLHEKDESSSTTWKTYVLNPIDFGWEHLGTVEETLKVIQRDEAALEASEHAYDLAYTSTQFKKDFDMALKQARIAGLASEFSQEPAVFWVPNESCLSYAFVLKEEDNGTTYVVSPVALRWLEKGRGSTAKTMPSAPEMFGSLRQIHWAQSIAKRAIFSFEQTAKRIPALSIACETLALLMNDERESRWFIDNRENLNLACRKKGRKNWEVIPESVSHHPLLLNPPIDHLDDLKPLLELDAVSVLDKAVAYAVSLAKNGADDYTLQSCVTRACSLLKYPEPAHVKKGMQEALGEEFIELRTVKIREVKPMPKPKPKPKQILTKKPRKPRAIA